AKQSSPSCARMVRGSDLPLLDSSDDMRKVQRREKNRIAAQKSRLRQTQKADTLHLESEDLERQNAALRREIKQLTEEMKHFTSVLSSHEPLCSILHHLSQPDACVPYSYKGNIFVAELSRPEILQPGWGSARCPQYC
uniref:Basic leucine zipper transcriptional factor ATF-like n=1 Tax=Meleagris gallopavo TaxID=9103 RepID=G1NJE5_MELGA